MTLRSPRPRAGQVFWPLAGMALGAVAATNPLYRPQLVPPAGAVTWLIDVGLVLVLSRHPVTARMGVLVAGLLLAVPCFLRGPPATRFFLVCGLALPFAIACWRLLAPPTSGLREQLRFCFTWFGTRELRRRARSFDTASLARLLVATLVVFAGVGVGKAVTPPANVLHWLGRWLAGGVTLLAFAELVTASHAFWTALVGVEAPGLMRSPHRSVSIGEFWSERWNPAASALVFGPYFFEPLVRRGVGRAVFAAFLGSAAAHVLLLAMATGRWDLALMWGAYFLVQPWLIAIERRRRVRLWRPAARRVWTLTTLAIPSPLIVEPVLQLIEPTWQSTDTALVPTVRILGLAVSLSLLYAVGALGATGRGHPCDLPS